MAQGSNKRRKELERQQKQLDKAAKRQERKNQKAAGETPAEEQPEVPQDAAAPKE